MVLQALCVCTLGSVADAQRVDNMRQSMDSEGDASVERFYLQYYFPPSSVGETGRVGPPGMVALVLVG